MLKGKLNVNNILGYKGQSEAYSFAPPFSHAHILLTYEQMNLINMNYWGVCIINFVVFFPRERQEQYIQALQFMVNQKFKTTEINQTSRCPGLYILIIIQIIIQEVHRSRTKCDWYVYFLLKNKIWIISRWKISESKMILWFTRRVSS